MIITYDIECLKHDWIIVFKENNDYRVIHNNKEELKTYIDTLIKNKSILVGFNNYHYDDIVLASIILDKDPYETTKKIIVEKKRVNYKLNLITLDVMQELPQNVGLKSSQANLSMNIIETPIDFDLNRPCTKEELNLLIGYCKNDVKDTEMLFKTRADYFQAKFEIVNEFGLDVSSVTNTRAVLSSKVLKCKKVQLPNDRLCIDYDPHINWNIIPKELKEFFEKCEYDFNCGGDFEEIESRKLNLTVGGIEHTYAFGGLHGAINKYNGKGNYLHVDVSSYYPSLIINNNFMSRASSEPQLFNKLREIRYKLKAEGNPKEYIYKILINATFGAMKSEYNPLFDPRQANNICINGQILLTQLIIELEPYCTLIQSNTDGLIIKYNDYKQVESIVTDFGKRFNLAFDMEKITRIAQRDVNNYVILFDDNKLKGKGRFAKYTGGTFTQNTLSIIDKCLVNYYINDIPVHKTIIECYKNNDLAPFQIICKMGNTYDGMYYEYGGEGDTKMIETQKVNRVFATNDKKYWGIYKRKGESYQKIANTSNHNIIHNADVSTFDKSKLDLNYYIRLVKENLY